MSFDTKVLGWNLEFPDFLLHDDPLSTDTSIIPRQEGGALFGLHDSALHIFAGSLFNILDIFRIKKAGINHSSFHELQWIMSGPGQCNFFLISVCRSRVQHGVPMVTVGHHFHVHWAIARANKEFDETKAFSNGQHIHTINVKAGYVIVTLHHVYSIPEKLCWTLNIGSIVTPGSNDTNVFAIIKKTNKWVRSGRFKCFKKILDLPSHCMLCCCLCSSDGITMHNFLWQHPCFGAYPS